MASSSELPEYLSLVKRRKIERDTYDESESLNIEYSDDKDTQDSHRGDIEGIYC